MQLSSFQKNQNIRTSEIPEGGLDPGVARSAVLNSSEKLELQRSKDIAYTINHAFACTAVDWLGQTPVLIAIQKAFGVRNPKHIGCSNPFHHHENGGECNHEHHHDHGEHVSLADSERALHAQHIKTLGKMFTASEIIGDFGGVIPTVLMQRYMPQAMDGVRPILRATLGPIFHWGAEQSTKKWAMQHGIRVGSKEFKEHLDDIYEHEMHHLPQAAWWTVWSSALNIALQQPFYEAMATPQIRHEFPLGSLSQRIATKIGGASLSIGLVLGTRALLPETAHRFTGWTEDYIINPVTKVVAHTLGVDDTIASEAIAEKKKYHDGYWAEKVENRREQEVVGRVA